MPPFYENAAQLLRALATLGLILCPGAAPHAVIVQLEQHFHMSPLSRRTHAEIAMAVLAELEGRGWVACDPVRRPLLIAALGTAIGNHRAGESCQSRADSARKPRR